MNFRNRGEHAHHYSTNAVQDCCICCGSTKHFIVFERFKLFRYFRIVVCMLQEVNTNNCLSDFELYFTGLLYMLWEVKPCLWLWRRTGWESCCISTK
jgi:hypothetical protein